jgi:spore germination cell wall hydrolase CwlJ-like protein
MIDNLMADKVFLALAVWREARGEERIGQTAVAISILNRVHRPSWWGKSVMEVLFKKWQYSSLTDPHDPQLVAWPKDDPTWKQCLQVASDAIDGLSPDPAPGADSYFDQSIAPPIWAKKEMFVCKIGHLSFYNVDMDTEVPHA